MVEINQTQYSIVPGPSQAIICPATGPCLSRLAVNRTGLVPGGRSGNQPSPGITPAGDVSQRPWAWLQASCDPTSGGNLAVDTSHAASIKLAHTVSPTLGSMGAPPGADHHCSVRRNTLSVNDPDRDRSTARKPAFRRPGQRKTRFPASVPGSVSSANRARVAGEVRLVQPGQTCGASDGERESAVSTAGRKKSTGALTRYWGRRTAEAILGDGEIDRAKDPPASGPNPRPSPTQTARSSSDPTVPLRQCVKSKAFRCPRLPSAAG